MNINFFEETLNLIQEGYKTANHTKDEERMVDDTNNKYENMFDWNSLWSSTEFTLLDNEMDNSKIRNTYAMDCAQIKIYFMNFINDLAKKYDLKSLKKDFNKILKDLDLAINNKQKLFKVTCDSYTHYKEGYISPDSVEEILDDFKSYLFNIKDSVIELQYKLLALATKLALN